METTKDYAQLFMRNRRAVPAERAQNVLRWRGRRELVLPLGGASVVSVVALAVNGSVSPPLSLVTFLLVYDRSNSPSPAWMFARLNGGM